MEEAEVQKEETNATGQQGQAHTLTDHKGACQKNEKPKSKKGMIEGE